LTEFNKCVRNWQTITYYFNFPQLLFSNLDTSF